MKKIVIAGISRYSQSVINYLERFGGESYDIVVIDDDEKKVHTLTDRMSIAGVVGSITNVDDLEKAEVKNANVFIAASDNDDKNIVSCMLVKAYYDIDSLNIKIEREEYESISFGKYLKKFGIDRIIVPYDDLIMKILLSTMYESEDLSNIAQINNFDSYVVTLVISAHSPLIGKDIQFLRDSLYDFAFADLVMVKRNEEMVFFEKEDKFEKNDKLFFVVEDKYAIANFLTVVKAGDNVKDKLSKEENVKIIGSEIVAYKLAKLMMDYEDYRIDIVVGDDEEALNLSQKMHDMDVFVVNNDILKTHRTDSLDINNSETIYVIATKDDQDNSVIALLLKNEGITPERIYCYLSDSYHTKILNENDINNVFTPDDSFLSSILPEIREGVIIGIHVIEYAVEMWFLSLHDETISFLGTTVSDFNNEHQDKFKIIAFLNDKNNMYYPSTQQKLDRNQRVVIVVKSQYVADLERMIIYG